MRKIDISKKYLALCISICQWASISAADPTGTVADRETGYPVPGVILKGLAADNSVVVSFQTDVDGRFTIPGDSKAEYIYAGYPGYMDRTLPLDSLLKSEEIVIWLTPYAATDLGELTVTASTVSTKGNVETFTITDELRKKTNSAIDLIGKLPGISVDPMTESVKSGSLTDIKIVVDGKEVSKSYYSSLNPNRIKKIELVRNSSGKYSQYPAILNIVLKNTYEGVDFNIAAHYAQSFRKPVSFQGTPSAGVTSSYTRWYYFISGDFTRALATENSGRELTIKDKLDILTPMPPFSDPNKTMNLSRWTANGGAGFRISYRQTVSGQFRYDRSGSRERGEETTFTDGISDITELTRRHHSDNYVAGLDYVNSISDAVSVDASVTYNAYRINERQNILTGHVPYSIRMHGDKDYLLGYAQGAFKIRRNWTLKAAYEYTWRRYDTHSGDDATQYYSENRHRPMVETDFYFGRFSGNVGLSYLDISNNNGDISHHHRSVLPRVNLYWQPVDRLALALDYYTVTEYPNLDMLSSQRWMVGDGVMHSGNPDLNANTTHYVEARLKLFDCLTLMYMYRHTADEVSPVYSPVNTGGDTYLLGTFTNVDFSDNYMGIQFYKTFFGELSVDVTANHQIYRMKYDGTSGRGRTWYLDINASWNVLKSGYYMGAQFFLRDDRRPIPMGHETDHAEVLMLTGSKMFFNNRLMVTLGFNIPTGILSHVNRRTVEGPGFRYSQLQDMTRHSSWMGLLNLRYMFSTGRSTAKRHDLRFEEEK